MDLPAQRLFRLAEYLVVVEGQLRHLVERKPACIGRIVAALHLLHPHQGVEGNGDDPLARVALRVGERVELTDVGTLQPRLFLQLPQRTLFGTLVHLYESAGKCPTPFVRLNAALHQEHLQFGAVKSKDDAVRRNARMRILVAIFQLLCCLIFRIHHCSCVKITPQR